MLKKVFATSLAVIMLAGCSSGTTAPTPSATPEAQAVITAQAAQPSAAAPAEIVKLSVELFDRSNTPADQGTVDDNRWTKWIQEEMLKRGVEVKYQTIPRGDELTKLNVLMASGTASDISFTYDRTTFLKYSLEGGLNDLTQAVDQYGEAIKARTELDILSYGTVDGKIYGVPASRGTVSGIAAHYSPFIRRDWLDKMNVKVPTNRDELVEVLREIKKQDPGNVGDKLLPFVIPSEGFASEPTEHFLYDAAYSFMEDSEKLDITTPFPLREGFKDFMFWMNGLFNEGLIDPNFAASKDNWGKEISQGHVGFFSEGWWVPYKKNADSSSLAVLKTLEPDAIYEPLQVWQNKDGNYLKTAYLPIGLYIFSPKTCKNPEAAVKYLNFLSEEETAMLFAFGVEGEHYTNEPGYPKAIDPVYNGKTLTYIANDLGIAYNEMTFPDEIAYKRNMDTYEPFGDLVNASVKMAVSNARPFVTFNRPIESQQTFGAEINSVNNEYWAKLIMAKDFDKEWDSYMSALEARNIKEIYKEREEYYNNMK